MSASSSARSTAPQERLELGEVGAELLPGDLCHWRSHRDPAGIVWLLLDKHESRTNTLSGAVLDELGTCLARWAPAPPRALVIRSAKPDGFIAGADINEFSGASDRSEVETRLRKAHGVVSRLAEFPVPTIAVIHGFCLGGGLELALACRHRIARPDAKLGLPEVMLGLHPGLGGTARLTALLSPFTALELMLTGRSLDARRAKRLGLVDAIAEERHVAGAVRAAASGKLERRRPAVSSRLSKFAPARRVVAALVRRQTARKARAEHYPAPFALIEHWHRHGGSARSLLEHEPASFARLLTGDTAQNLIRVFFLRERLKRLGRDGAPVVRAVHVIGAGTMGGDIAAWCALKGISVSLQDQRPALVGPAIRRAAALFERRLKQPSAVRAALDRLVPDHRGDGVGRADLVIEAVPENADLKREIYAAVEPRLKSGALLATNTSSIRLEHLGESLRDPARFVGVHFFNPVAKLPLVEVVSHDGADPSCIARAHRFVTQIDRLPLPVRSAPGFLVNRALTPYLLESLTLLEEGLAPETIDAAALRFGMPMGPLEVADQVGLDVCLHVTRGLREELPGPWAPIPAWVEERIARGDLGRKSGRGVYEYRNARARKQRKFPAPDPGLEDRLILPLINACVACLRAGVVQDRETVDAGLIFGTGFAPFRGGPMHYAETRGESDVVAALKRYREELGSRFEPDAGWEDEAGAE